MWAGCERTFGHANTHSVSSGAVVCEMIIRPQFQSSTAHPLTCHLCMAKLLEPLSSHGSLQSPPSSPKAAGCLGSTRSRASLSDETGIREADQNSKIILLPSSARSDEKSSERRKLSGSWALSPGKTDCLQRRQQIAMLAWQLNNNDRLQVARLVLPSKNAQAQWAVSHQSHTQLFAHLTCESLVPSKSKYCMAMTIALVMMPNGFCHTRLALC